MTYSHIKRKTPTRHYLRRNCVSLLNARGYKERMGWASTKSKLCKAKSPTLSNRAFLNRSLAMTYSHMGTPTLPSAQLRFTSEFGMGSGGTTVLWSLDKKLHKIVRNHFERTLVRPVRAKFRTNFVILEI